MRILFAWELGDNFGHLMQDLSVALQLRAMGHEVRFAVFDCKLAEEILTPLGVAFFQAPRFKLTKPIKSPPINYSDLLLHEGLEEHCTLRGALRAWLELYSLIRPDVIVVDHAPVALLATRLAQLGAISLGSGFTIPPDVEPFPSIRPWEDHGVDELRDKDRRIVTAMNSAMADFQGRPIESLQKLFLATPAIFANFPELDHYGVRAQALYVGPLTVPTAGKSADWPMSNKRKIFAYLRPSVTGAHALLQVLAREPESTLCSIPGLPKSAMNEFALSNVQIHSEMLELAPILRTADLVISYGGAGILNLSLLAGVPLLLVPNYTEQYLGAKKVEALGAGVTMGRERSPHNFKLALERLRSNSSYRDAAQKFSREHADYTLANATASAAEAVLAAAI